MAESVTIARAGADRLAAGYIWRARAGGASGEVQLSAEGGGPSAGSLFKVRADRLQFIGDFTEFFGNVSITGDLIVNGAVSRQHFSNTFGSQTVNSTAPSFQTVISEFDVFFQNDPSGAVPLVFNLFCAAKADISGSPSIVDFDIQARISGTWTSVIGIMSAKLDSDGAWLSMSNVSSPFVDPGTFQKLRVLAAREPGQPPFRLIDIGIVAQQVNK